MSRLEGFHCIYHSAVVTLYILCVYIDDSDKVNYAKTMAKGYLQSVGSGEYTPQTHGHSKHTDTSTATDTQPVTNWKRTDSEEFDF